MGFIKYYKLFFFLLLIILQLASVHPRVLVVNQSGEFKSISNTLSKAIAYDTVIVKNGYYKESNLIIDKPLTLIGRDNPVIDGDYNNSNIISINSSNVIVSGFIIKNVGVSAVNDNAGIKVSNSTYCKIEKNRLYNTFFGIYLAKSKNCYILNNEVVGNGNVESQSGNGIHLWQCSTIVVQNNRVTQNRDGIYFEFVSNSSIQFNYSSKNNRYGLHFMFSDNCDYLHNDFVDNGAGVAVMYTKNINMKNNRFINNWGASAYGLLLKDIRDSFIYDNEFKNNTIGILAEGSNRLEIKRNNFIRNGWAVKIMANCIDDVFTRNNFISNTFDVATNSKQSFNKFFENYWSEYDGYDLNHDNYGDVPYHPVSLFSYLTSQNEPAIILLRSIFINLLDAAEKVFPSITPEALVDAKPLMRPIK
jgi:nitrous oxidase accessory protein